ncbi:hypothetical protein IAT38_008404 [Cryptococcus sp. DSM 104549]
MAGPVQEGSRSTMTTSASPARREAEYESYQPRLTLEKREGVHRVSCDCCRVRKIKCTGEKPVCSNCERRKKACSYPSKVRRRGPDKKPGTRQRGKGIALLRKRGQIPDGPASTEKEGTSEEPDAGPQWSTSGAGQDGMLEVWSAPADVTALWAGVGMGISLPPDVPGAPSGAYYFEPPTGDRSTTDFTLPPPNAQIAAVPYGSNPSAAAGYGPPSPTSPANQAPSSQSQDAQPLPLDDIRNASFYTPHTGQQQGPPPYGTQAPLAGTSGRRMYPSTVYADDGLPQAAGETGRQVYGVASTPSGGVAYPQTAVQGGPLHSSVGASTGKFTWHSPESLPEETGTTTQQGQDDVATWRQGVTDWSLAEKSIKLLGHYAQAQQELEEKEKEKSSIVVAPLELSMPPGNIQAARDGWWNWILDKYDTDRRAATRQVITVCGSFFANRHTWLNFLQRDVFFHSLFHSTTTDSLPSLRAAPHILLAILALTTLDRDGHTVEGQQRALVFASEARSLLSYCVHAGSQDPSLVAATLILSTFEVQPHLEHSTERVASIICLLDGFGLSVFSHRLDAEDTNVSAQLTGFPRVRSLPSSVSSPPPPDTSEGRGPVASHLEQWVQEPEWNPNWTQGQMWKEEMRRMCWSVSSVAAHYTLWRMSRGESTLHLDICHPEKYRLLFPGEAVYLENGDYQRGKTTPWALYFRLTSLWHFVHNNTPLSASHREIILDELNAVEDDITFMIEEYGVRVFVWQTMGWTMLIRRIIGAIDKPLLTKWYRNQLFFLSTLTNGWRPGLPGIVHRPMHCWWHILQCFCSIELSIKYPDLWEDAETVYTRTLQALEEVGEHWHCAATLHPFVVTLQMRHTKALMERQKMIQVEMEVEAQRQGMSMALTPAAADWLQR